MTTSDEGEIPWTHCNALAERIHEALAEDGTKQPVDVIMACLIVIAGSLRWAPSEAIFAHEIETMKANLDSMLEFVRRVRDGDTGRVQ
jgi:hypothetical protein